MSNEKTNSSSEPLSPSQLSPHRATSAVSGSPAPSASSGSPRQDDVFAQQLQQKKRARRGRIWKALGLFVLLGMGGGWLYATQTQHGRDTVEEVTQGVQTVYAVRQNPNLIFERSNSDHVNILLIGRDVNYKQIYDNQGRNIGHEVYKSAKARSATMIIVSLDRVHNTIRMMSLPRDARVYIPENEVETGRNKLNAAHAFGGVPLVRKTLHDELGITIHHYAVIKFDGFKKLIDEVGGVYVDVIGALHRDGTRGRLFYEDKWGGWKVDLKPGKQWLNGEQAHGYVRFRMDTEGDPGRIRRQQSVMRALASSIKSLPPWKMPGMVKEIRRQFETDLSDEDIASAGLWAQSLGDTSGKIQPVTMFGVYGTRGSLTLNKPKNEMLLKTLFGPTFNPDNFLQRSPWTENDEIGLENNSSPAAKAVLREAGLLPRLPGQPAVSNTSEEARPEESLRPSRDRFAADRDKGLSVESSDANNPSGPLGRERSIEQSLSSAGEQVETPTERPRRRSRRSERDEPSPDANAPRESAPETTSSREEPRSERRRRVRRERAREASQESSSQESSSREARPRRRETAAREESPIPRPEADTSANNDSELSVESPVPQPEP